MPAIGSRRIPQTVLAGTGRIAGMARSYTTLAQANGFILFLFLISNERQPTGSSEAGGEPKRQRRRGDAGEAYAS